MYLTISIIILLIPLFLVFIFIRNYQRNIKYINSRSEWGDICSNLCAYIQEIKDDSIRGEYVSLITNFLLCRENTKIDGSLKEMMRVIETKYINHIPSLKNKIISKRRSESLHKILKDQYGK